MPQNHVPLPLSQDWLIKRLQALGYTGDTRGMCYGIIPMVMQAIFLNELDRFYKRLQLIASIPVEEIKEKVDNLKEKRKAIIKKNRKEAARYYDNLSLLEKEKINAKFENKKEFLEKITALKKILDKPNFRTKFDKSIIGEVNNDEKARTIILNKYKNEFLRNAYLQNAIDKALLNLPEDEQLALEIPAFFEGLELNQQGYKYPKLLKEEQPIGNQNAFRSMQLTSSKKLEKKKYFKSSHVFSDVYNKTTLTQYLNNFQETLTNSFWLKPVLLSLHGTTHSIAVCFDPKRKGNQWLVIDSNEQELLYQWVTDAEFSSDHQSFSTPAEVADKVINNFEKTIPKDTSIQQNDVIKPLPLFSTQIYSQEPKVNHFESNLQSNHPLTFNNVIKKWKEKNDSDGLHIVTKEKAMVRNASMSWVYLTCRDGDIESLDLLTKVENINLDEQFTELKHEPLRVAVSKNRLDVVKLLLNNKVKTDLKSKSGNTILHCAANDANFELVKFLLTEINDVNPDLKNEANDKGETPLHIAVKLGRLETVRLFLDCNADIELKAKNGNTAFHEAASHGQFKIVEFLLSRNKLLIELKNNSGEAAQHLATKNGHLEILELLLSNGIELNDKENNTLLHVAASHGQYKIVEFLLGRNTFLIDSKNNSGETALHLAAQNGHVEIVELLLSKGADLDLMDKNKCTALESAIKKNVELLSPKKSLVDLMDKNKAEPLDSPNKNNHKKIMEVFLHFAVKKGHSDVVKFLLFRGEDVDSKNGLGLTLLHQAVLFGHENIVNILLAKGANLLITDTSGYNPLHLAAKEGKSNLVKILLEVTIKKNVDINLRVRFDATSLHLAVKFGHLEVAKVLLSYKGIEINFKDQNGDTALHLAAATGDYKLVKLLINSGANPNAQNHFKATALQLAKQKGHSKVVDLLTGEDKQTQAQPTVQNNSIFTQKNDNNDDSNAPVLSFFSSDTFKRK